MADFAEALEKLTDVLAPSGLMLPFAGKSIPDGWLLCNGAAVSRTTYADLFAAIGTAWGTGDGSTTFNLPNCDSRFMEGTTDTSKVGTYLEAGLPNITGSISLISLGHAHGVFYDGSGFFSNPVLHEGGGTGVAAIGDGYTSRWYSLYAAASNSSAFYNGNTVQPKSAYTLMIIKV